MTDTQRQQVSAAALREATLDALVCALPKNVLMLSGYWPVIGTGVAIALRDGETRLLVPEDELTLAQGGEARRIETFRPGSLDRISTASEAIIEPLQRIAPELARSGARIGFESGETSEPVTYAAMHLYQDALRDALASAFCSAELVPSPAVLTRLRRNKTAYEIDMIRRSTDVARIAFERGSQSLRPGLSELEAAAAFQNLLIPVSNRAQGFVFCMSGPNAAEAYGAYARSRGRRMRAGDLVLVHCNSCVDGYWTDITRTYVIGPPDERQQRMYDAIFAARDAVLRTIAPGKEAREVDRGARDILTARGFGTDFKHSTGHGIGFGAISASDQPRLHPQSPDVLEPGMVFNVEPGIYIDGYGGMRHCDMVAVTTTGYELLTDFEASVAKLVRE